MLQVITIVIQDAAWLQVLPEAMAIVLAMITLLLAVITVLLEALAIALAVTFYVIEYRSEKRKEQDRKRDLRKSILSALKQELEMDWAALHCPRLLEEETDHPEYYDPRRQIFKYRDDAMTLALSVVESDVLRDPDLARALLDTSQAVRFVNQQIEELMAFRFGDPVKLARATACVDENPDALARWADGEGAIPATHRTWFKGLALRHWAIVNEGYWKRLLPSLRAARAPVDAALEGVGLPALQMPEPDEKTVTTPQDVFTTGSVMSRSATGGPVTSDTDDSH